jgi:uncharacterized secreted repeat protein (TIGR03808 family)
VALDRRLGDDLRMTITRRRLLSGAAALAAFTPAGALAQTSAAIERGFVNAADFGLVSNPVPLRGDPAPYDQSYALQEAINAAAAAMLPLFVPGGFYGAQNLALTSWLTIFGVRGATNLQAIGDQPILTSDVSTTITLRDLVLDGTVGGGNDRNPALLVLRGCEKLELDGLRLVGGMSGLYLDRCGGIVENLVVEDSRDNGIFSLDSFGLGLVIANNRITNCGNGGIRVWRSEGGGADGSIVANNIVSGIRADGGGNGQNGNGINVYRADGVTVSGNKLTQCAFSAIRLNATNDTVVSANTCLDSGEVAIFSEFAFSGSVIAGNIVDRAAQGISITNFNEGGRLATCTGNIVRNISASSAANPDTTPAGIFAEADAVIANNVVESVPGVGIGAGWGPYLRDVTVSSNLVRDVDIGIAVSVAEGAGAATVTGNRVSGARRAAIAGMAWQDVASDDLARDAARYPAVTLSGNSVG